MYPEIDFGRQRYEQRLQEVEEERRYLAFRRAQRAERGQRSAFLPGLIARFRLHDRHPRHADPIPSR